MYLCQTSHTHLQGSPKFALTSPENTITYLSTLLVTPKFCISIVFTFSWELKWPQEKLKTMLMQNFGVRNEEYYGMLLYFLKWSIRDCDDRGEIRGGAFKGGTGG